jgi:glycosyltransferase involved in cell wall biosynthesis
MPCLLKRGTDQSPAVVTFTHNELFYGVIGKSDDARKFLSTAAESGRWIFGIHVQGDCSHLERWPLEPWQSFLMWPDVNASFLSGVPKQRIIGLNCVNFLPAANEIVSREDRRWDICIISRPSRIKRIVESLHLVKQALVRNPTLRVIFVVPDYRKFGDGARTYETENLDRRFYQLPMSLFSATELRQISFISSSVESFGRFPIAQGVLQNLLARSKFMLLTSHSEGTPRVIAEALMLGTPCMVSPALRSGMGGYLTATNCVCIDDDAEKGATQLNDALSNYDRFAVDTTLAHRIFSDVSNRTTLMEAISDQLHLAGKKVEGEWLLDDLHLRLAGHGRKRSLQVMNDRRLFFRWFANVDKVDPYDEDSIFGPGAPDDKASVQWGKRVRSLARIAFRR